MLDREADLQRLARRIAGIADIDAAGIDAVAVAIGALAGAVRLDHQQLAVAPVLTHTCAERQYPGAAAAGRADAVGHALANAPIITSTMREAVSWLPAITGAGAIGLTTVPRAR